MAKSYEEMKVLAKAFEDVYNQDQIASQLYPSMPAAIAWIGETALYHYMQLPAPPEAKYMLVVFMQGELMSKFDSTRTVIGESLIRTHAPGVVPRVYVRGTLGQNFFHWNKDGVTYGVGSVHTHSNFECGYYTLSAREIANQSSLRSWGDPSFTAYAAHGIIETQNLIHMFKPAIQAMNEGIENKKNTAFRDIAHVLTSYKAAIAIKRIKNQPVSFALSTAIALNSLMLLEKCKALYKGVKQYMLEHYKDVFQSHDDLKNHLRDIAVLILPELKDQVMQRILLVNHGLEAEKKQMQETMQMQLNQLGQQQQWIGMSNQYVQQLGVQLQVSKSATIAIDEELIKEKEAKVIQSKELEAVKKEKEILEAKVKDLEKTILENKTPEKQKSENTNAAGVELNKVKAEKHALEMRVQDLLREKNELLESVKEALESKEKMVEEAKIKFDKKSSSENEYEQKGMLKIKDNEIKMLKQNIEQLEQKRVRDIKARDEKINKLTILVSDGFNKSPFAEAKRLPLPSGFSYLPDSKEETSEVLVTDVVLVETMAATSILDDVITETTLSYVAPEQRTVDHDVSMTEFEIISFPEKKLTSSVTQVAVNRSAEHLFTKAENSKITVICTFRKAFDLKPAINLDHLSKDEFRNLKSTIVLFPMVSSDGEAAVITCALGMVYAELHKTKDKVWDPHAFVMKLAVDFCTTFYDSYHDLKSSLDMMIQNLMLFENMLLSYLFTLPPEHPCYFYYSRLNVILEEIDTDEFSLQLSQAVTRIENLADLYVKHFLIIAHVKTVDVQLLDRFFEQYNKICVRDLLERGFAITLALSMDEAQRFKFNLATIEAFHVQAAFRVQDRKFSTTATVHTCLHQHAQCSHDSKPMINQELVNFIVNRAAGFLIGFCCKYKDVDTEFHFDITESALYAYMGYKQAIQMEPKADIEASLMQAFEMISNGKLVKNYGEITAEALFRYSVTILFDSIDAEIAKTKKEVFDPWFKENEFFIKMPENATFIQKIKEIFEKLQVIAQKEGVDSVNSLYALHCFFSCFTMPAVRQNYFIEKGFLAHLTPLCSKAVITEMVKNPTCILEKIPESIALFKMTNPVSMPENDGNNEAITRTLLIEIVNQYMLANKTLSKEERDILSEVITGLAQDNHVALALHVEGIVQKQESSKNRLK